MRPSIDRRRRLGFTLVNLLLVFVILAVLTILSGLFVFIPKFEAIFSDFGTPLPRMTVFLLGVHHFMIKYFYIVFMAALSCGIFFKLRDRNQTGASVRDRILLPDDFGGAIVEKPTVSRTARTLGAALVVLGGIIGYIVIALFLPLITLMSKLSG